MNSTAQSLIKSRGIGDEARNGSTSEPNQARLLGAPPVYRPQATAAAQPKPAPVRAAYIGGAPPVYRPQAIAAAQPKPASVRAAYIGGAPPVYRPQTPAVAQQRSSTPVTPSALQIGPFAQSRTNSGIPNPALIQCSVTRPTFTTDARKGAYLEHNLLSNYEFEVDISKPDLPSVNGTMPHRMSWKDIRDNTLKFAKDTGSDNEDDFERWTNRFIRAGRERLREYERHEETTKDDLGTVKKRLKEVDDDDDKRKKLKKKRKRLEERLSSLKELNRRKQSSHESFVEARDELLGDRTDEDKMLDFLKFANSFHANVPDLGPHRGVNNPVLENVHLHVQESRGRKRKRSLSPMSRRVVRMSPGRLSNIPVDDDGDIITTTGKTVSPNKLRRRHSTRVNRFDTKKIKSYDPDFEFGS